MPDENIKLVIKLLTERITALKHARKILLELLPKAKLYLPPFTKDGKWYLKK